MTEDYYWIGAQENMAYSVSRKMIIMVFIYLSPFERQVRPMLNKLPYLRYNWNFFCELASGFCNDKKSTFEM